MRMTKRKGKQIGALQKAVNAQQMAGNVAPWLRCSLTRGEGRMLLRRAVVKRRVVDVWIGYPIVTVEVDARGCVGGSDEDDRMLVDEEEYGLKNTLFGTWRNAMWRMVSLFILYRSRFAPGVVCSTPTKLNLFDFKACWKVQTSRSLVSGDEGVNTRC